MKKRWILPIAWGIAFVVTLALGWFSWFKFQSVPETLIVVVCGTEGLVTAITGVLGITEVIKEKEKDL